MRLFILLAIALCVAPLPAQATDARTALAAIIHDWDMARFKLEGELQQRSMKELTQRSKQLSAKHPGDIALRTWYGIALAEYAELRGGIGALPLLDEAKEQLQRARRDGGAEQSSRLYAALGRVYQLGPDWVPGFGDDEKAEIYLRHALEIDPGDVDAVWYLSQLLIEHGRVADAAQLLRQGLSAPMREGRRHADEGRRNQFREALARLSSSVANVAQR